MKNRTRILENKRNNNKLHSEKNRKFWQKNRQEKRFSIIRHYSPEIKCQHCGNDDARILQIDHINGGGGVHRKQTGSSMGNYYWIIKNNFPPGFQILCPNCQMIKRWTHKEGIVADWESVMA